MFIFWLFIITLSVWAEQSCLPQPRFVNDICAYGVCDGYYCKGEKIQYYMNITYKQESDYTLYNTQGKCEFVFGNHIIGGIVLPNNVIYCPSILRTLHQLMSVTIPDIPDIPGIEKNDWHNILKYNNLLENIYVNEGNGNYYSIDGILFKKGVFSQEAREETLFKFPRGRRGLFNINGIMSNPERKIVTIGSRAFENSELTKIFLPVTVKVIEFGAFNGCKITAITIPDSVQTIESYAFQECTNLETIEIPEQVKSISEGAFMGCKNLRSVVFKGRVESIGDRAFEGCINLNSITIPDTVKTIGVSSFEGCRKLKNVNIPNITKSIGSKAFAECSSLERVTVPDSVASLGNEVFRSCTSLVEAILSKSVECIDSGLFKDCTRLNSVVLSDSLKCIENEAFMNCESLKSIELPNTLTEVGERAFRGSGLQDTIILPGSVRIIGEGAFTSCKNLKIIKYLNRNVRDNITISYVSVDGVLFDDEMNTLIQYPAGREGEYYVPNTVTYIFRSAFRDCKKLTSVIINSSVVFIDDNAFYGCDNLVSVTYLGTTDPGPNVVNVFEGCNKLKCINVTDEYTNDTFCGLSTSKSCPVEVNSESSTPLRLSSAVNIQGCFYKIFGALIVVLALTLY